MGRLVLGGNSSNHLILGSMTILALNFKVLGFNNWDSQIFYFIMSTIFVQLVFYHCNSVKGFKSH